MKALPEVWGWIETENGKWTELGLKMASETARLAGLIGAQACAIAGTLEKEEAEQLKRYGIGKAYLLDPDDGGGRPLEVRAVLSGLSKMLETWRPRFLLLPADSLGNEWAARLSLRCEADVLGEIVDYNMSKGRLQLRKSVYGGKAHALFSLENEEFCILTVSCVSLEKREQPVGELEIHLFPYSPEAQKVALEKVEPIHWSDLSLNEAEVIIGVGRGVGRNWMEQIKRLAEAWNCPIGGSKVADESGLIAREYRIGASGKTVATQVYVAIGISGAPHHLAGIKDVKHLAVINPDLAAPITENAEVVIGLPVEDVVPAILKILENRVEGVS
ncbi:electron transfer flavoprotein subunit alpha/FixB family protein [Brevibacillus massiliensis]|uniref:electron transfer flavoprotein subunit alpha/FixB family protein n=1 Tax=Brevibacillus massiliensis TaxID=1118054 RepID=UPI0003196D70|nr:FAD-binding protein [Brevibacillus massiliensis]